MLQQPYDVEVGAGTMAPETFLRVLGPMPYKVAYVQPSRRPADGRYGENPNRLFKHMQLQVILKPPPENVQELYLESLAAIGIDLRQHDIKFEEDNWEAPTLSAWGVGWQVMLDGLEITQFTYFQQCGGVDLFPISVRLGGRRPTVMCGWRMSCSSRCTTLRLPMWRRHGSTSSCTSRSARVCWSSMQRWKKIKIPAPSTSSGQALSLQRTERQRRGTQIREQWRSHGFRFWVLTIFV